MPEFHQAAALLKGRIVASMPQALVREGATHFVAVPSMLRLMLPMLRVLRFCNGLSSPQLGRGSVGSRVPLILPVNTADSSPSTAESQGSKLRQVRPTV